ncbi:MAG: glycerol kinase GlpK [Bacteroidales bacterium]|nr:glycerol kinase GlpK [Bacteroidales bacterium]
MDKKYILALDQGTSSARAIIYDKKAKVVGVSQLGFSQFYPQKNLVEQDPDEIFDIQIKTVKNLLLSTGIDVQEIAAVGITNQRETTIVWDKITGEAIYPAIVWQDKRTEKSCINMRAEYGDIVRDKTGLVIDSYFSATKVNWILDNVEGARVRAENGELAFGTVDTWLVYNLTNKKEFITDYSNASRTLLFNINTMKWDDELLEIFNVPKAMLPKVVDNGGKLAMIDASIFGEELILASLLGDQQASLFGHTCFEKGSIKSTYGTGSFMLMNTGDKPIFSKNGLLTTIAWRMKGKTTYALEGNIFIAGAAIKWLRDQLQIINSADESEYLAMSVPNSGGVKVIPAFAGLGAPYWNNDVQGAILGLTLGTKKEHIVRATLEALAYRTKDMLDLMEADTGMKIKQLAVDGGASANNFLMQYVADVIQIEVDRPKNHESTSLGVAYMAGLSVGFWNGKDIRAVHKLNRKFKFSMDKKIVEEQYNSWSKTVRHMIDSAKDA